MSIDTEGSSLVIVQWCAGYSVNGPEFGANAFLIRSVPMSVDGRYRQPAAATGLVVGSLRALREQIEQTKVEMEKAERAYDLNRAAELKYGKLAELERRLQAESDQFTKKQAQSPLIKEEVGEEDIAEVVSR